MLSPSGVIVLIDLNAEVRPQDHAVADGFVLRSEALLLAGLLRERRIGPVRHGVVSHFFTFRRGRGITIAVSRLSLGLWQTRQAFALAALNVFSRQQYQPG